MELKQPREWIKNQRYGEYIFDDLLDLINKHTDLIYLSDDFYNLNSTWAKDIISFKSKSQNYVVETQCNRIKSIHIWDNFFIKRTNMIGSTISNFKKTVGLIHNSVGVASENDFVSFDDGDRQTCYDFDDLGALVWIDESSVIKSISIMKLSIE